MAIQKRLTKAGKTVYIARWRDPAGKEHSKSFTRQKEAKAHVQEMERASRLGIDPTAGDNVTVRELMTLWIEDREIRPSSLALYTRTRDKHLGPLADWPAKDVTPKVVRDWQAQLRSGRTWISKDDTGMSPRYVQTAASHLRSAYKWGIENELVAKNPVRVERVQAAVEPDDVPTMEEIQAVIDRARYGGAAYTEVKAKGEEPRKLVLRPDPMFADMLTVAAFTGLRIGELCGLLVEEVNLGLGVVQVRKQLDKRPPHGRVVLKSKNSRRDVPISAELRPVLERVTAGRMPGEFLFTNRDGRPFLPSGAGDKVLRVAMFEKAPRVHFHALRHHFASSLLLAGVPVPDVARVLGHTPAQLLKTYTHALPGSGDRVAAAISASVGCGISAGSTHLRVVGKTA
ncbi:tyrosine-type recombinase/integrase [Corynebacterium accolens]|uniref:tyrosine-type recombinase/integrase n=1 Tax=Corynebacterium accolens TaxID=38284 RepID=UPI00254AA770|nr:site-specific integrase [Corynebacterium accolens]MDK8503712.1 tyrosine-type recombinase/integrase [Corynebacterium accolens]MDK8660994.1 tyrosine-type recombinase/integrase [Corynebacterium accolens]